ncbi:MAG TPA: hypothetical protein VIJ50_03565 [Solirubrobacteraceae bacterium]
MHRTVQQLFQIAPKAGLVKESASPLHVDEQIEVASWSGISSGNRSEHLHTASAVKGGHPLYFVASIAQFLHGWCWTRRARVWVRLAAALDSASKLAKAT